MGAMATEFRTFQNINGYSYDADKTDTIYAEDLNKISQAIEDLETEVAGIVAAAVAAAKEALYPVGSIYHNETDDRNPSVILGFGEWEACAPGRVLVGKANSGTFSSAGGTVGSESHNHGLAGTGSALIGSSHLNADALGFASSQVGSLSGSAYSVGGNNHNAAGHPNRSHNTKLDGYTNNGSTIQPSLVVYIWKRTA